MKTQRKAHPGLDERLDASWPGLPPVGAWHRTPVSARSASVAYPGAEMAKVCTSPLKLQASSRRSRCFRLAAHTPVVVMTEDTCPMRWINRQAVMTLLEHIDS